ncbi:TRAP transporter substrate-binding protein [Marinobacterium marinum]|uniref:TRAP transporter substrate-binding protein DctP n=1 Tax=Marinobacterium marinum TaxID=2756129 RepID=A0A7W1WWT1_9GAMM|nr:TRAP transporter substrate-binding protein DctP [Marinobacterium marinum]MBA4501669.1 TRAP transporter substrate-binding protein DctP [Marinobacterium marinum]
MTKLKALVGACTVALATLGSAVTAEAATWRYAFEEALTDVQGVYASKFKEHIEANSDHTVQLFPYGTLGESADIMEQAQAGLLQFVDQSPGFTGSLIPEAQIFFIPYLLPETHDGLEYFFRNSKAINEAFKSIYAQHGLELLKMFPEGEVVITTQEAFDSPAGLDGVKIRVMTNPLLVESYKAFGATPTPLPWGEVYGGLQTNIIQGQENPLFWVESAKMYEVTDVMTFTGHNNFTTAVMANKRFFDRLPEQDQQLVQDAMQAAFDHIMVYQKGLSERSLEKILEQKPDMKIVRLTEEQRQPFRAAAEEVEAKFIEMTGDPGRQLLQQFKQDLNAAKAQ